MAWLKNCCVRFTGRACISPMVRGVIRYDHTAMAVRQPKISPIMMEAYSVSCMVLCSAARTCMVTASQRLTFSSCKGSIMTHTAAYRNSSGQ